MKFLYALIFPQPFFSAQARPNWTRAAYGSQRPIRRDPLNGRWFAECAIAPKPINARVSWLDGAVAAFSTRAGTIVNAEAAAAVLRKSLLLAFICFSFY